MNYSKIATRIRGKIRVFFGDVSAHLGKVCQRLVFEVVYGMISSQSVMLTAIARALRENIPLKKTHWRLSRNLQRLLAACSCHPPKTSYPVCQLCA